MPIEQEPIKIEIHVEEEEVVMLPERSSPDAAQRVRAGTERLSASAQRAAARAREAWESEKREHVQARVKSGLQRGGKISQAGLMCGLSWLSNRLARLAERFTPVEQK